MALDAIKEVSEAERRADLITEEAHREARAIIAAAKVEGEKSCDDAVESARAQIQKQLAEQEKLAVSAEAEAKQRSIAATAKLESSASAKMDKAVEFIINKVTDNL